MTDRPKANPIPLHTCLEPQVAFRGEPIWADDGSNFNKSLSSKQHKHCASIKYLIHVKPVLAARTDTFVTTMTERTFIGVVGGSGGGEGGDGAVAAGGDSGSGSSGHG